MLCEADSVERGVNIVVKASQTQRKQDYIYEAGDSGQCDTAHAQPTVQSLSDTFEK